MQSRMTRLLFLLLVGLAWAVPEHSKKDEDKKEIHLRGGGHGHGHFGSVSPQAQQDFISTLSQALGQIGGSGRPHGSRPHGSRPSRPSRPSHGGGYHDRPSHGGGYNDRPSHGGGYNDRPSHGGGYNDRPSHGGGYHDDGPKVQGVAHDATSCVYWNKDQYGQLYCGDGGQDQDKVTGDKTVYQPATHRGRCPTIRDECTSSLRVGKPINCTHDGRCLENQKCCIDACVDRHICKPAILPPYKDDHHGGGHYPGGGHHGGGHHGGGDRGDDYYGDDYYRPGGYNRRPNRRRPNRRRPNRRDRDRNYRY